MADQPEIIERPEQPYLGILDDVTMDDMHLRIGPLFQELFGQVRERGITPAGPEFIRYHVIDMARRMGVEVGVPVDAGVTGTGRVTASTLPAGRYATVTHVGHPQELVGVTADLLAWAESEHLAWDVRHEGSDDVWGARVEFTLTDPSAEPDMSKWETQLAFRLAD
ncbi:MAG: GyrI-like domain-containing protein [Mycobacteriales bacterium]